MIAAHTGRPIYSCWDFYLVGDVVGGLVVSGRQQGEASASMAVHVLRGVRAVDIPIQRTSPNVYMFDYGVMERFGVQESALPKGSVVINKPQSVFDQYGLWIIGIASIAGLQTFLIFALLLARKRSKAATEALRQSKALLSGLKNNIPDLVWIKDKNGVYLACNPAFERLYGAKEEAILGRCDHDFVDAELANFFRENDRKAIELDGPTANEELLAFKDTGYQGLFETIKTPMRDDSGNLIGVLGIARDISDRKQSEQSLRQLSSRLAEAQKIAQVGDWEWIIEENKVTWSDQMFTLLGLDSSEHAPTYEENLALYHDEDSHLLKVAVSRAITDGTSYQLELRRTKPDGSEVCLQARGLVDKDATGKVMRLYGSLQDITERKQSEEALLEAEWKFRALFENGPIGVAYHEMIYDSAGNPVDYRFIDANESYLRLTGVDPRGKTVTQAFHGIENDPFDWIGTFGRVARTGQEIRFESYLQANEQWYDCVGYQYKPDHFVAAFLNITDRKNAQEALLAKSALLEAQTQCFHRRHPCNQREAGACPVQPEAS